MDFLPNSIVEIIINETESVIKDDNLREQVKLFEKVLELPIEQKGLKAVGKGLRNTLVKVYGTPNNHDDCVHNFRNMNQYEEYMKKLLYISNKKKCMELMKNSKLGLGYYMVSLGVFTEELARKLGQIDLEKYRYKDNYLFHNLLSYKTRNDLSHESQSYSYVDIFQRMQSLLVSMISVTWKYKTQIISEYEHTVLLEQSDFITYCNQIILEYEDKRKKGFTYTEVKWIQKSFNTDTHNLDNISHEESQVGNIKCLRDICQNEKRMMLMGEAGAGKSTSVEYLQYLDAKKYIESKTSPVPVVMKLISISEQTTIEEYIMTVLNITKDVCINMLERGFINLYLDGINEMITNLTVKSQMVNIIENTLHKYPKTYFVITDRIFTDNCINITLPTFTLHPMDWEEICDFTRHNSGNEVIAERVIEVLQQHDRLKMLANTPFKLKQLIQIISTDPEHIPENSVEYTKSFINALLKREFNEKRDINAGPNKLKLLLMALSMKKIPTEGLNTSDVIICFRDCIDKNHITMEPSLGADLAIQLGILKEANGRYDFTYQEYKHCLETEALLYA